MIKYNDQIKLLKKQSGSLKTLFLYYIRIHSISFRPPCDIDGYIQFLPGIYKSGKPINITGINKIHLKCDCLNCIIVDGCRKGILYSHALDKPPGRKLCRELWIKQFEKIYIFFVSCHILHRRWRSKTYWF